MRRIKQLRDGERPKSIGSPRILKRRASDRKAVIRIVLLVTQFLFFLIPKEGRGGLNPGANQRFIRRHDRVLCSHTALKVPRPWDLGRFPIFLFCNTSKKEKPAHTATPAVPVARSCCISIKLGQVERQSLSSITVDAIAAVPLLPSWVPSLQMARLRNSPPPPPSLAR